MGTVLGFLCMGLLAAGCEDKGTAKGDGGTTPGTDGQVSQTDGGGPPPPPTGIVIFKKAGESAEASFDKGDESFLVLPYFPSESTAEAIDYAIKVTSPTSVKTFALRHTPSQPMRVTNPALWARWQDRLAAESWARSLAQNVVRGPFNVLRKPGSMNQPMASCTLSSQCKDTEVCQAGTCTGTPTIKVEKFATTSKTKTITTKLMKKGKLAAILVDDQDTVQDGELTALLDAFEKIIYPRDVALFGNPPLKAGSAQLSSDRNADGLVWLVLTSKVSERKSVGFFAASDFDDVKSDATSNEADILYVLPPSTKDPLKNVYPILAHELQHLLGFGNKAYRAKLAGGQAALEALWLDEGLSHFAEDACGYGGENVTLLDQELFPTFSDHSLFSGKDSMGLRALALTFVRWLFEQKGGVTYPTGGTELIADKGGAAWLKKVHASAKIGTAVIGETFGDPKEAFDHWLAAVALDGRGVTDYVRWNYQALVEDPLTKNTIGLKIRGKRRDATGAEVELKGPIEAALAGAKEDTIKPATSSFFLLSGQKGKVTISVTSKEAGFRFAVVRVSK
ncbi:MAG: hypothetical protein IT371_00770 [Deltaproteobacteria bacterium]|nr:hypothetical protein [Deltaproteobacteria bacterium]